MRFFPVAFYLHSVRVEMRINRNELMKSIPINQCPFTCDSNTYNRSRELRIAISPCVYVSHSFYQLLSVYLSTVYHRLGRRRRRRRCRAHSQHKYFIGRFVLLMTRS